MRSSRIIAAVAAAVLALGVTPAFAVGPDPNTTAPPTALEPVATDVVERGAGHIDVGPRWVDDQWRLMERDDTASPQVWRHPDKTVLRVNDRAMMDFPGGKEYEFLGIDAGQKVYVIPQTQKQGVLWLGWNTQSVDTVARVDQRSKLVLHSVEGPGAVQLFIQNGFGAPESLWNSTQPTAQAISMELNTHVHANWIFTKPGAYRVNVTVEAKAKDGAVLSAPAVLLFAVGDAVTTEQVLALGTAPAKTPASAAPSSAPAAQREDAQAEGSTLGLALGGVAVVLVLVGVGVVVARRKSAAEKAAAREDDDE